MVVFLGGTCNGSTWRDRLTPVLKINYFNPVVKDWTPECQARELEERANADIVLYVITPAMAGVYGIAEVVDDSNKRPAKTVFAAVRHNEDGEFDQKQWKSIQAVADMVSRNGGKSFTDDRECVLLHMLEIVLNNWE